MCIFTKKFRTFDPHPPIVSDDVLKRTDLILDTFPYYGVPPSKEPVLKLPPGPKVKHLAGLALDSNDWRAPKILA